LQVEFFLYLRRISLAYRTPTQNIYEFIQSVKFVNRQPSDFFFILDSVSEPFFSVLFIN